MAGSTAKKVLIRRFDRDPLIGYVHPQTYLRANGIELLTPDGSFAVIPYAEVKSVHFVRDFDMPGTAPERLVFYTRPKINGLWIRMRFRDADLMEGILPNNLLQLEAFGFTVIPPDQASSGQKVFVPRAALDELQVLGVIGSPLTPVKRKKLPSKDQIELFER